jgi:LmbE family N-acetylglucosaminyl deacetylase
VPVHRCAQAKGHYARTGRVIATHKTGNACGLGDTRAVELRAACHQLGVSTLLLIVQRLLSHSPCTIQIRDVHIVDDPQLPDSMSLCWPALPVLHHVTQAISTIQPDVVCVSVALNTHMPLNTHMRCPDTVADSS